VGAPVRLNMLNMPKSASVEGKYPVVKCPAIKCVNLFVTIACRNARPIVHTLPVGFVLALLHRFCFEPPIDSVNQDGDDRAAYPQKDRVCFISLRRIHDVQTVAIVVWVFVGLSVCLCHAGDCSGSFARWCHLDAAVTTYLWRCVLYIGMSPQTTQCKMFRVSHVLEFV